MLRRESDSHGLFSSGETSDNDCEVSLTGVLWRAVNDVHV